MTLPDRLRFNAAALLAPLLLAGCAVGANGTLGTAGSDWKVLDERSFDGIGPGMSASEVRPRLGQPAHVFNVGWQRLQVWNYRFTGADCVWYQVSIGQASQRVTEAGMGYDPKCDGPNDRQ